MAKDRNKRRQGREYDFPIPERSVILTFLRDRKKPALLKHIAEGLSVRTSDERAALNNRLKAMLQDGQIIKTRRQGYGLVDKMDLIPGKVIGHPDGYGFLKLDDGGDDLFIPERQMRSVLHGDRALFRIRGKDRRGRTEAGLVEILKGQTLLSSGVIIRRIISDLLSPITSVSIRIYTFHREAPAMPKVASLWLLRLRDNPINILNRLEISPKS